MVVKLIYRQQMDIAVTQKLFWNTELQRAD